MKYLKNLSIAQELKKEVLGHKVIYGFLAVLLLAALFVRVYRTDVILHFFFDQGRDAKEIWELIHQGDFFLIGPTTGIAGIFRGPFYYYLITPFYFLGGGNPVWPAVFLAVTSVVAIALLYCLAKEFQDRTTGIIAVILASFSFYIMRASRWLSNPTPMLLLSMALVFFMYRVTKGKKWAWAWLSLVAGLSLFHFGSSGEFFYFPALLVFFFWQRKNWPTRKIFFVSVFLFFLTASPLVLFDLKNDQLLSNNISAFLFQEDAFKASFTDVAAARLGFYKDVVVDKIFPTTSALATTMTVILASLFVFYLPDFFKSSGKKILLLMAVSPLIGFLFFQGNAVYDYYFTGYYFIFILIISATLGFVWKSKLGKIFVIIFLYTFLSMNWPIVESSISDEADGPQSISFRNQKQAIDWVYKDANGAEFNVDVYVPPVIPHAYDYLFMWYPKTDNLITEQTRLLYTLYEVDPPHPERLEAWLDRQAGIGSVEYEESFGGITVQRRARDVY